MEFFTQRRTHLLVRIERLLQSLDKLSPLFHMPVTGLQNLVGEYLKDVRGCRTQYCINENVIRDIAIERFSSASYWRSLPPELFTVAEGIELNRQQQQQKQQQQQQQQQQPGQERNARG